MEVSNLVHRKSPVSQAAQVFFPQTQAQAPAGRAGRAVAEMLKQQVKLYRSVLGLLRQATSLGSVCSGNGSLPVLEPEIREQGVGRAAFPWEAAGEGPSCLFQPLWPPGDPWLLPGSLQSCLFSTQPVSQPPPPLIRTPALGFGAHLKSTMISRSLT